MQGNGGKSKNDLVREQLVPLREGERPHAVTSAMLLSFAIGAGNLIAYASGVHEIGGTAITAAGILPPSLLLVALAIGMWRSKYWAVLGFEAFLALVIVTLSLALMSRTDPLAVLMICTALAGLGALFWFLVRAMARIQMPNRLPRE